LGILTFESFNLPKIYAFQRFIPSNIFQRFIPSNIFQRFIPSNIFLTFEIFNL